MGTGQILKGGGGRGRGGGRERGRETPLFVLLCVAPLGRKGKRKREERRGGERKERTKGERRIIARTLIHRSEVVIWEMGEG